jgi:hypothetical protein
MARIKLPSYLKEGSGRMEDAVIVTRGGESYMMPYKKHDSGNTPAQQAVRDAFKTVVADWKYLKGIIGEAWGLPVMGTNVSGYNHFLGVNASRRRAGLPLVLCPGTGGEVLMNFKAAAGDAPGGIVCSFIPPGQGRHVTFFVRRVTASGVIEPVTRHEAGAGCASPFVITGLEPATAYHVHAIVTDAVYDEANTVSRSVAAECVSGS